MGLVMRKLIGLLVLSIITTCVQADEDCTYFTFGLGGVFPNKSVTSSGNSYGALTGATRSEFPEVHWDHQFNKGWNANFAYGYYFTENLRGEVEAIYQRFNRDITGNFSYLQTVPATGTTILRVDDLRIAPASAHVGLYSLMTNAICDFTFDSELATFLGAGFGFAWIHSPGTSAYSTLNLGGVLTPDLQTSPTLSGSSFALQFKAGVTLALYDNKTAILQYRLFTTARYMAKTSRIHTNPGQTGEGIFTIPDSTISGLVNSMVEICIQFG